MSDLMKQIMDLSVAERILLVEAVWDSIAIDSNNVKLTKEQDDILDKRMEAYLQDPERVFTWDQVKSRIQR